MKTPARSTVRRDGVALVLILAFVVLLTVVVVAFFSRAVTARQVSSSSASQNGADTLARSAANTIIGDLKQEIAAGSTAYPWPNATNPSVTIYTPTADPTGAATPPVLTNSVVPWVSGVPTPSPGGTPPIPNLLRRSVRASDSTFLDYPSSYTSRLPNRASAVNSTADLSANGRSVSAAQWNAHYLIPLANPSANPASSVPTSSFIPPDWVMITKEEGPAVLSAPTKDANGNTVTAIGRFAYAIYDEGGLLDANVAGGPSNITSTSTPSAAPKGFAAFADLTAVGLTQQQSDNLVGWRNYATTQPSGNLQNNYSFTSTSATNYFNYILGQSTGFLTTNTTKYVAGTTPGTYNSSAMSFGSPPQMDQVFASRQSLIKFWTGAGFPVNSLQYFGTFTRDLNRPNFVPLANPLPPTTLSPAVIINYPTPTTGNPNPPQSPIPSTTTPYPAEPNPIVQNLLIPQGTAVGTPLAFQRFPLRTLALLENPTANTTAIKHYFGLTYSASPKGNASTGLYHWTYSHTVPLSTSPATTIMSLAEVAALTGPRETGTDPITGLAYRQEPDFFEYLQAAVLYGSLGNYNPANGSASSLTVTTPPNGYYSTGTPAGFNDAAKPSQFAANIMQMGLNLIDQYDADNVPTVVGFNGQTYAGIENLPYLSEVLLWPYRPINTTPALPPAYTSQSTTITTVGDPNRLNLAVFAMIELWNPHQNAANLSTTATSPVGLRLQVQSGAVNATDGSYAYAGTSGSGFTFGAMPTELPPGKILHINFNNSTSFQEPDMLGTDNAASSTDGNWYLVNDVPTSPRSGILLGVEQYIDKALSGGKYEYAGAQWNCSISNDEPILILQFTTDGTNWFNYQGTNWNPALPAPNNVLSPWAFLLPIDEGELTAVVGSQSPFDPTGTATAANNVSFEYYQNIGAKSVQVPDPRTKSNQSLDSADSTFNLTIRPLPTTGSTSGAAVGRYALIYPASYAFPVSSEGYNTTPNHVYPGMYNENDSSASNAYTSVNGGYNTYNVDPDGVLRPGDGYYGGNPLAKGNLAARPIILNRPFRSVGEMGYANRGWGVWKSINFFSEQSADAGLLDYFSIDSAPISAGKINLNTRQSPVLQAMLQGAYRIEPLNAGTVDTLKPGDAGNLATAIINHTTATVAPASQSSPPYIPGPLVSRADLVRSLLGDPAIVMALKNIQGTAGTDPGNSTKTRREALVRALADVGTTRTWNLLIDIVAQAGIYPQNAGSLNGFVVQGEKHYWLHVAIDRYTGAIIDQQMELVNE